MLNDIRSEILYKKYDLSKDTKNTSWLIFNFLRQKKLIFNYFVNRNWKKLTDSRKRAKILADNRKSHHLIETLLKWLLGSNLSLKYFTFMYQEIVSPLANGEIEHGSREIWL